MGLFVDINVSSLNAQRQLLNSGQPLNLPFERLSSGFRINRTAIDATGLQMSDRLTSQVQGLDQSVLNSDDAILLVQTAKGALGKLTTSMQPIHSLGVKSQNGINSSSNRNALHKNVTALRIEISRIATDTQFGNLDILQCDFLSKFLEGANGDQTISVNLSREDGRGAKGLSLAAIDESTFDVASSAPKSVASAISVGGVNADFGALQNRFQCNICNLSNISENIAGARSRIRDIDFTVVTAELTNNQIIQQASLSVLSQDNQRHWLRCHC